LAADRCAGSGYRTHRQYEAICEFVSPRNRPLRPVAVEIRDWIIEQMRNDASAIDRIYPRLGLMAACYGVASRPSSRDGVYEAPHAVRR